MVISVERSNLGLGVYLLSYLLSGSAGRLVNDLTFASPSTIELWFECMFLSVFLYKGQFD